MDELHLRAPLINTSLAASNGCKHTPGFAVIWISGSLNLVLILHDLTTERELDPISHIKTQQTVCGSQDCGRNVPMYQRGMYYSEGIPVTVPERQVSRLLIVADGTYFSQHKPLVR